MGLRFHSSFKLFPGVRLHVSKSGLSTSFGVRGASINVSGRGVRGTVGIPGTGLSYSQQLFATRVGQSQAGSNQHQPYWSPPVVPPPVAHGQYWNGTAGMTAIASSHISVLTSPGLAAFRQMIIDARQQRGQIELATIEAKKALYRAKREFKWKGGLLAKVFARRVSELSVLLVDLQHELNNLNGWHCSTHIEVEADSAPPVIGAHAALISAFQVCCQSWAIWDVTAHRAVNQVQERTIADRIVHRIPVRFGFDDTDLIKFSHKALRLANANGQDMLIFPNILLVPGAAGDLALIDIREINIKFESVQFIETEQVPPDSRVVGYTWQFANKDGSPDRRYSQNTQIPICEYGLLKFMTATGLNEEFQLSNAQAAAAFSIRFEAYRQAIISTCGP